MDRDGDPATPRHRHPALRRPMVELGAPPGRAGMSVCPSDPSPRGRCRLDALAPFGDLTAFSSRPGHPDFRFVPKAEADFPFVAEPLALRFETLARYVGRSAVLEFDGD